jgi:hypothetical protein
MGMVFDLEKRLLADPTQGREELRRIFRDGRITLVPEPAASTSLAAKFCRWRS